MSMSSLLTAFLLDIQRRLNRLLCRQNLIILVRPIVRVFKHTHILLNYLPHLPRFHQLLQYL